MVEDYPVINTAVVEYKKKYCPQCTDLVIMTLLVWGEDKNHMFAYNDEEYKQSLTVLHTIAKRAQTEEGGSLRVTVRSTLNADDDFVYSAYSPHLVLPLVTPSSWHQLLTYSNRAVFDPEREQAAEKYFDTVNKPKRAMPGRRISPTRASGSCRHDVALRHLPDHRRPRLSAPCPRSKRRTPMRSTRTCARRWSRRSRACPTPRASCCAA